MRAHRVNDSGPQGRLGLFDSVSIIVGIIIGVGIYESAPLIASSVSGPLSLYTVWIIGGALSVCGALCYAELASAYPKEGGDYHYLNRAYGSWAGFLFAWANLLIVRPGSIAAMAFPFASYFESLFHPFSGTALEAHSRTMVAAISVALLTVFNIVGVDLGKWTQNFLTVVKVLGLVAIFALCYAFVPEVDTPEAVETGPVNYGLALILVLFCYGGWNEIAYVAQEVREPKKNILRALLLGVFCVSVVMLLVNAAFVRVLGFSGMAKSGAVAADAIGRAFPAYGASIISFLVCVSAAGAINGLILTGSRISYALGCEHRFFGFLSLWSSPRGTPVSALEAQGILSILLIFAAGSFTQVLVYTTAVVWLFFLLSGISVFVLRRKEPDVPRPYRVTFYPWTTLIFCGSCVYLIQSALSYDLIGSIVSLAICLLGVPVYLFSKRKAA